MEKKMNFQLTVIGELLEHEPEIKKCSVLYSLVGNMEGVEMLKIPFDRQVLEGESYDKLVDVANNCLYKQAVGELEEERFKNLVQLASTFSSHAGQDRKGVFENNE
jgi:hypothetical protein